MEKQIFKLNKKTEINVNVITTIVNLASRFTADIKFIVGSNEADAKSLINLIALDFSKGNEFGILVEGTDAYIALETITKFLKEQNIIDEEN